MRLLLLGTFDSANASCSFHRGFKKLGIEVIDFPYRSFVDRFGIEGRNKHLIKAAQEDIDIMVILKGDGISKECINECNKYTKTFLWYMDALKGNEGDKKLFGRIEACSFSALSFHDVFLKAKKYSSSAHFVQDGYDVIWDKPFSNIRQIVDIGFVGKCYGKREEYKQTIQFLHREGLYCEELSRATGQTKINLCFTDSGLWPVSGPSARMYKILAHGGFLLLEIFPWFGQYGFVDGRDLVLFSDEKDLSSKIKYYLKNPALRKRIAAQGQKTVQPFSRDTTAKRIIEIYEKNNN